MSHATDHNEMPRRVTSVPQDDLNSAMAALSHENQRITEEARAYRERLILIESSRSWRLTRPLRRLANLLRRERWVTRQSADRIRQIEALPNPAPVASAIARNSGPPPPEAQNRAPDVSPRLLQHPQALCFLALGMTFSEARFNEVVDMLDDIMAPPPSGPNDALPLREALIQSVQEAMEAVGSPDVRIGLTGGLDSRLLYGALRQIYEPYRITPYTFGYPGQYDYEFVKKYGDRFLENHLFVETKEIEWNLEVEAKKRRAIGKPGTYNAKSIMYKFLSERGVSTYNIHGFMGDPLTGATKPNSDVAIESWDDAVKRFLKKNDRFNLQRYFSDNVDLSALLPSRPAKVVKNLDDYELLDFGLRQFQRILPDTGKSRTTITPYTNRKWISSLVSIGETATREAAYYQFVREDFSTYFPELAEFDITNRRQHKKFREEVMQESLEKLRNQKNGDGSGFTPQIMSDSGRVLAGRQFCEYSEYHNNASFKAFFDQLYEGLLERQLFSPDVLEDVRRRFLAGTKTAAEQMKGLMSLELNLRAGTIDL